MAEGCTPTTERNPVSIVSSVCVCFFTFHEKKSRNIFINIFVKKTNIKKKIQASRFSL